jgi:hypothetical protein
MHPWKKNSKKIKYMHPWNKDSKEDQIYATLQPEYCSKEDEIHASLEQE